MKPLRILLVDDDEAIINLLQQWLGAMGHDVATAHDGEAALLSLQERQTDLVFLDLDMPKVGGVDVLRRTRKRWQDLPVIILTAYGSIPLAVEAMRLGAADFLCKPITKHELGEVLGKALERSERKDEMGRVLGQISHDVKSLLMPVVCGVDLLESEIGEIFKKLPEMDLRKSGTSHKLCDEVIELLRDTARRLQGRMKEVADFVKSESSPPVFAPCDLRKLAEGVIKSLHIPADHQGISLRMEGFDGLPSILADDYRLFTALYNLVNNAMGELSTGGSIIIRGSSDAASESVVLSVQDTGRGMPPEVLDSLFTARTISLKAGGTGLGTKIVKDVVNAHGGEVSVESKAGIGTTFYLRLPCRPLLCSLTP